MANQIESVEMNDTTNEITDSLPKYKCKKCLKDGVDPVSVHFETTDLLFEHYDLEHISKEEHKLDDTYAYVRKELAKPENTNQPIRIPLRLPSSTSTTTTDLKVAEMKRVLVEQQTKQNTTPTLQPVKLGEQKRKSIGDKSETTPKLNTSSRKKRVNFTTENTSEPEIETPAQLNEEKLEEITNKKTLEERIENAKSSNELKYFNLTLSQVDEIKALYDHVIDEEKLAQRVASLFADKSIEKSNFFVLKFIKFKF